MTKSTPDAPRGEALTTDERLYDVEARLDRLEEKLRLLGAMLRASGDMLRDYHPLEFRDEQLDEAAAIWAGRPEPT